MELEELKDFSKELGHVNEKQEKRVHFYETRAHVLTIVYIVFQGIILISVSLQSSSNQCKRWWVIFTISLLSSLIFFMAFVDAVRKFYKTQYHVDVNYMELQIINKHMLEAKHGHSIRIEESSSPSSSSNDEQKRFHEKCLKPDVVELLKRKVYIIVTLLVLIVFSVVMLYACRSFLCNGGSEVLVSPSSSP